MKLNRLSHMIFRFVFFLLYSRLQFIWPSHTRRTKHQRCNLVSKKTIPHKTVLYYGAAKWFFPSRKLLLLSQIGQKDGRPCIDDAHLKVLWEDREPATEQFSNTIAANKWGWEWASNLIKKKKKNRRRKGEKKPLNNKAFIFFFSFLCCEG